MSKKTPRSLALTNYSGVLTAVVELLESARHGSAKTVNSIMTAAYWEIGRRIVEFEQKGKQRAAYGIRLIERLSADLTQRFGRGFSSDNLEAMRRFYLTFQTNRISETPSRKLNDVPSTFPLPWSHYVRLLKVEQENARNFYAAEALRGGWTVRQLDRQISTLFYERALASRKKTDVLKQGEIAKKGEQPIPEDEIRDPFILEFLGLKDEYSESDLEEALVRQLESFLLELGGDFAFVGRQRRLRIGDEWYRVDLLFFHRKLRSLIVIDLKLGKFTHADAGQMHLYLNYATEHWMNDGENPPIGVILCTQKDHAVVRYALEGLPNKVLAAEYRTKLPDEAVLASELERTRKRLESRIAAKPKPRKP